MVNDGFDESWTDQSVEDPSGMIEDANTTFAFDIPVQNEVGDPSREKEHNSVHGSKSPDSESPRYEGIRTAGTSRRKPAKISKRSRYGTLYCSLPRGVVKSLAVSLSQSYGSIKGKIDKETLGAIVQAGDWFLEQIGDDLSAYAEHAGRKVIGEADMITLMKRFNLSVNTFTFPSDHLADNVY